MHWAVNAMITTWVVTFSGLGDANLNILNRCLPRLHPGFPGGLSHPKSFSKMADLDSFRDGDLFDGFDPDPWDENHHQTHHHLGNTPMKTNMSP